jgi:hypothetical protein
MSNLAKYRAVALLPVLLMCGYVGVVFYKGRLDDSRPEVFPFFNWSLFSSSGSLRAENAVLVRSIDGRTLPSPRLYYDMKETFVHAKLRDVNFAKAVQSLGQALHAHNEESVARMRSVIEQRYMADVSSAKYDVVLLTYDPIRRLRTGEIKKIAVLASYTKTRP